MTRTLTAYLELLRTDALPLMAVFGLERAFPAERRQPLRSALFNIVCFLVALPILLMVVPWLAGPKGVLRFCGGCTLFEAPSGERLAGGIAAGLLVVFGWDFLQYWAHRTMHAVPWLWEIHKLHHTDVAVSASTAYRNHVVAHIFQCITVSLPLALVMPVSALSVTMVIVFFHLYGLFNHMNVRLSLGVLTPVFSGPQLHRIHHSSCEQHYDRNFAAFFPILDILFGTYFRPAADEFPPTGIGGVDDRAGMRAVTVGPFIGRLQAG